MKQTITAAVVALAFAGAASAQPTLPEDRPGVRPLEPSTTAAACGGAVGGLVVTTGSVFNPALGVVVWYLCMVAVDSGFLNGPQ